MDSVVHLVSHSGASSPRITIASSGCVAIITASNLEYNVRGHDGGGDE